MLAGHWTSSLFVGRFKISVMCLLRSVPLRNMHQKTFRCASSDGFRDTTYSPRRRTRPQRFWNYHSHSLQVSRKFMRSSIFRIVEAHDNVTHGVYPSVFEALVSKVIGRNWIELHFHERAVHILENYVVTSNLPTSTEQAKEPTKQDTMRTGSCRTISRVIYHV